MGRGDIVAILAERSTRALTGMLAVMKTGAAYLPLDPAYPEARIAFVLEDARPKVLLADREPWAAGGEPPGGAGVPVLRLDALPARTRSRRGKADAGLPGGPLPGDPAYVLYTSGSTGRPKGVVVPHRALLNFLVSMRELLGSTPDDVWLALTSLSFDISGLELYLPLVTGGRIVVADPDTALDGQALARRITSAGVTHVQATPSGWRVLLEGDIPRVTALVGGEALPPGLARELKARTGRLVNVYGPTETTIWSTAWEVPDDPGEISIGRPIGNTTVAVVDAGLNPVPPRAPGELVIGGLGLADGYLHRPELTAERFIDGVYRTGDLVRWTWDGTLEFLGRNDDQVKLRGHRIELGEIESVLESLDGVTRAAVAVKGTCWSRTRWEEAPACGRS